MSRSHPVRSSRLRRRLATSVVAGGIIAGGLAVLPSAASARGLSTTLSQWSSADFALADGTTVTVAGGVDDVGVIGQRLTRTRTVSISIDQTTCTTGSAGDVLVTKELAAETPVPSGVSVNPLLGSASVKTTVQVNGTETRTPAGTGGDCGEPNPARATSAPISDTVKLDVGWRNAPRSSPLIYGDIYQQGVFYYRDAVAKGTIQSATTGSAVLSGSTGGWLWSGGWVYATGT